MTCLNTTLQIFLSLAATIGIIFYIWNLLCSNVGIVVVSQYGSLSKEGKIQLVYKFKTDSTADIIIENLHITADTNYGKIEMRPINLRWKGFLPVMKDANGIDSFYALTGPLNPDLRTDGIKSGVNQYYICLESVGEGFKADIKVTSLNFEIQSRSPSTFAPPWLTRKSRIIKINLPIESKDYYFDDSLIKKISEIERKGIIEGL